jgi:hypothetical protein
VELRGTVTGEVKPLRVMPVGTVAVIDTAPGATFPSDPRLRLTDTIPPGVVETFNGSVDAWSVGIAGALKLGEALAVIFGLVALVTVAE